MPDKYELNGHEKYRAYRKNRKDIAFDGYSNKVYFNEAERTVTIQVDRSFEYDEQSDNIESADENDDTTDLDLLFTEQQILDSGNDFLFRDVFHLSTPYEKPLAYRMNLFSGLNITFPVGEGILNFCYADFKEEYPYFAIMSAMMGQMKNESYKPVLHNSDEAFALERDEMEWTLNTVDRFIYRSVYSSTFPPHILNRTQDCLRQYAMYIQHIQQEMKQRIEFVFDDEFYPDELSHLKAHERFALYCDVYEIPRVFERTELFSISVKMDNTTLSSCRLPMDEIRQRLTSHVSANEKSPLEEALNLEAGRVSLFYHVPHFMAMGYDCCTIHDMMELEFSKMLEYGIRLHKCKNCGRYFIVKGNYAAEYCDRIRDGQTRTCQQIAAQKKYEEKLQSNEAVALFRKYYKRYYARTKVGTIKQDQFRQWNYRACEMRERCLNGKISCEEFEEWLVGCFRNRGKR